jgi:phosphoenolpyruvate phosphomutase
MSISEVTPAALSRSSATTPVAPATTQLRRLLGSSTTHVLMEAHSGLSAKVVEEAGLPGIWASGLAISAALGVRDANEASWSQVLDVVDFMSDATSLPILLDADTGFGNFNNVRRLVRKAEQCGVAGICIEDKLFPKTNSFIGERQPLADAEEFAGKIRAAKDSRTDEDFCVVARVEALISGWDMDEALRRARIYRDAGADAVLIHSKAPTAAEVLEFARRWQAASPLVVVPTTYGDTPMADFEAAGIGLVIWANHLLRATIVAMRDVARTVASDGSPAALDADLAPVSEVFRLQDVAELLDAERRYLPLRS